MDHGDNEILELVSLGTGKNKSGKEFKQVIRYLFENPKVLSSNMQNIGEKFAKIGNGSIAKRNHGLDIEVLAKLYENIHKLGLDDDVSAALKFSLSSLEGEGKLKQLL